MINEMQKNTNEPIWSPTNLQILYLKCATDSPPSIRIKARLNSETS